jgi:uncharacterized PurR-regulated membrane protein YhhQ (DUF165 family)
MTVTRRPGKTTLGVLAALAYFASIVGANWMIGNVGHQAAPNAPHTLPVGFGLTAPSGVYLVGVILVLRDYLQWSLGKIAALGVLAAGIAVSYVIADPHVAVASAAAFAVSELLDFGLFTWVSPRWSRAVLAGGIVGAVADSVVFLLVAFGSLAFVEGQIVGKLYGVAAAAIIIGARRSRLAAAEVPA